MKLKSKLPSISALTKKADKIFSRWIRDRDVVAGLYVQTEEGLSIPCGYCFTCGKITPTEGIMTGDAGHFVKRGVWGLRYDPLNVHLQCKRCNKHLDGNEGWYAVNLDKKYETGTAARLKEREAACKRNTNKPYKRGELLEVIERYKK